MLFLLTGAAASHAAVGDPLENILVPLLLLGCVMTSWALRSAREVPAVERLHAGLPA